MTEYQPQPPTEGRLDIALRMLAAACLLPRLREGTVLHSKLTEAAISAEAWIKVADGLYAKLQAANTELSARSFDATAYKIKCENLELELAAATARAEKAERTVDKLRNEADSLGAQLAVSERNRKTTNEVMDEIKIALRNPSTEPYSRWAKYCRESVDERDALRKALEHIHTATHAGQLLVSVSLINDIAHAALHGTAKQEPKPRTCGECEHYRLPTSCPFKTAEDTDTTCNGFRPRAEKAEAALERDIDELIKERDEAEECIDDILDAIGVAHEWSNAFGFVDAIEAASEHEGAMQARIAELEAALNQIANYDTGPLGRTDADAQRWRGMARAALARQPAKPSGTYVDEDGDTVCIDTRTVIPARQSAKEVAK